MNMCTKYLKILLKCRIWFSSFGVEPRILYFWQLPGDVDAAGHEPQFEKQKFSRLYEILYMKKDL